MDKTQIRYLLDKKPEEIIEYFKAKGIHPTWDWKDLWQESSMKAFTVTKVMEMDILQDIKNELVNALESGETLQTFKQNLESVLANKGWWKVKKTQTNPDTGETAEVELGSNRRLKQIYETNLTTSYRSGQFKQQWESREERPNWMYVCKMLPTSREEHKALNGKVFPATDPFWDTFYPPNGFNCRCDVIPLTDDEVNSLDHWTYQPKTDENGQQIVKNGIPQYERVKTKIELCRSTPATLTERDAEVTINGRKMTYKRSFYTDPKTGVETSTDRGWNYNPGKATYYQPDLSKYDKQFVDEFLKLQAEFMQNLSKKHQSSSNIAKTLTSVVNGAKIINNIANVAGTTNSLKTAEDYIEDIKQFDWWKGLTKEDAIAFEEDLKRVSPERLSLLQKYCKDMQVDFYSTDGSFYNPSDHKVRVKDFVKNRIDSEIRGFKRKSHCFLHETGHWIDYNMIQGKVLSENLPELRKKLNDDVFNYVNKVLEKKDDEKIKNLKQLKELSDDEKWKVRKSFATEISENGKIKWAIESASVSDVFDGATRGELYWKGQHSKTYGKKYWDGYAREHEVFAEFMEIYGMDDKTARYFKDVLPQTYQYLKDYIDKLL